MKELFSRSSLFIGLLFLIFTAIDGALFGWNSDTTLYGTIACIALIIFLALELYFAPELDDDF